MRTHIRPQATILTLCLSLAAAAAFAADGPRVPPAPPAPPAPADSATLAAPADTDESAMRDRMEEARRQADEARRHEDVLRAQMEAARRRLEVAAQQLAALSAQVNGPMMQRVEAMAGPTRVLVGIQLDDSSGVTGARVREVSPGGPAERAGVRAGDLIVAVNGTDVRGPEPAGHVVRLLRDVKPGDRVDLKVLRDGTTRDLTATARPDGDEFFVARQFPAMPAFPATPAMPRVKAFAGWDGPMIISGPMADMELARLTPGLGRYFGTDTGVLVVRAPAKGELGLQDGDVILSIDGRKPIDSSHVIRIFGSYDPGEKLTLDVLRLHHRISVVATVPAEPPMARLGSLTRGDALLEPGVVVTLHGNDRRL
jgi:C-terminal processing protease CtpA/Prc